MPAERIVVNVDVMSRPRSLLPPEGIYHVTTRGVSRMDIVRDDHDRARWCRFAEGIGERFLWACHAYCLMNNHFHLVVEAALDDLSRGMAQLNGRWARRFNERYDRTGHVFEARFEARVIADEDYYDAAVRYVLDNPVRAGLCARGADWPWSGGRLRASLD
jgi:putative transposase